MAVKKTKVEVYGETSKYERSMRNVQRVSRSTSSTISSHWSKTFGTLTKLSAMFGIAGVSGFVLLGKNAIEAGDLIHKLNLRLGISTESLSQLQHAANLSGVEFNAVAKSFQKMQENISDAGRGIGEAKDALEQLGLDARQLQRLSPERQLETIADALLGVSNQSDKVRIAADIFGSRGVQMLQLMSEGAAGIKRMREEADRLGITLTQAGAQSMADANDAMTAMKTSISGVTRTMVIELAPTIEDVANKMAAWVAQNRELIGQVTHEAIDKIKNSVQGFVDIYNSLPEGLVGASTYGIVGRILFGSNVGKLLFTLKLLEPYFEKLPEWAKSWSKMLGGGIPEGALEKLKGDRAAFQGGSAGALSGAGGSFGPMKLTIRGPGTRPALSEEADMWAKGWASAEAAVQETWQQSAYGFNQLQEQLLSDQNRFAEMKKAINDISLQDRVEAEQTALQKIREMNEEQAAHEKVTRMAVVESYQQAAGNIANTFMQIAQAGGKQSKEAFKLYQGFAMVEASIGTALAITKTLGQLGWWGIPLAIAIGAMGAIQVAMIASAKPPSYDQGGISTTPGMYYAGIPEAHVPLKGGAIPVALDRGGGDTFIIMENPVFQDLETQQAAFANIAERIAPNAVVRAYDNDHTIRSRIRGRA